ncbi:MAG: hypothetical protein LBQ68_08030 [Clostridiales bacterium]|nr:hypothetical protein [Clostridiales bacterium]
MCFNILPEIKPIDLSQTPYRAKRGFIVAEGFEQRSLGFVSVCQDIAFNTIIVCRYLPQRPTKYDDLLHLLSEKNPCTKIEPLEFNRDDPFEFEVNLQTKLTALSEYKEIVVDISVMSKYMIMQIFCSLVSFPGSVRIIYTEPMSYAPRENEFEQYNTLQSDATLSPSMLPSSGVHNVVRTPLLTSIVMQKSPVLLVSFLSFNEQLIGALLAECNPMNLYLINGVSPHAEFAWREDATQKIHEPVLKMYPNDNPTDTLGALRQKVSILDYRETFNLLATIYKDHCVDKRIVLAPTGTKMQALGCALIKLCCSDIHVEYPIPESYYVEGYSSSEIRQIHQVVFENIPEFIRRLSNKYKLNE